jgi:hypothetical protein
LRQANERLQAVIAKRERAEQALDKTQADLAQLLGATNRVL